MRKNKPAQRRNRISEKTMKSLSIGWSGRTEDPLEIKLYRIGALCAKQNTPPKKYIQRLIFMSFPILYIKCAA